VNPRGFIMAAVSAALIYMLWFGAGCAHAHLERYVEGEKVCEIESWVLGTGETEQVTNACGDYAYSTKDTGISDNGKAALGMVAEGAVRGIMPLP
jgi:hypothetical protein